MEESLSAGLSQGRAQIHTVPIILCVSYITSVYNPHRANLNSMDFPEGNSLSAVLWP